MLKKTLPALAAVAVLTLAACSSGADANSEFLNQVHAEIEVPISDDELIGMVEYACESLEDGGSMMTLAGIAVSSGMDVDDASWAIGVGVGHFCPEQMDKLG